MRLAPLVLLLLCACQEAPTAWQDSDPINENDADNGCFDGVDNDNDLMVDCDDPNCSLDCDADNLPAHSTVATISPADPTTADDLTCTATTIDPDGDPLTWAYTWLRDGAWASSDQVVPSSMTAGYDQWTCEAVPFDGELDGVTGVAHVDVLSDNACMALSFDQTHQVQVPRFAGQDLVGTDFTVEAWAFISSTNASGNVPIAFSDPQDDLSGWRVVVVGAPGQRALRLQLGGGIPTLPTVSGPSATVPEDQWTHLAVSYELATGATRLHVNGIRVYEDVLTDALIAGNSSADLSLGGTLPGGAYHLIGMLDEVRISTVARYDDDFEPKPWFEPEADTLALWHFDEGTGSVAGEAASGNDGVIGGASWVGTSACDVF